MSFKLGDIVRFTWLLHYHAIGVPTDTDLKIINIDGSVLTLESTITGKRDMVHKAMLKKSI